MTDPKNKESVTPGAENPDKNLNKKAFEEAYHDIEADPEISATSPNDDLDEEESRDLGEDEIAI